MATATLQKIRDLDVAAPWKRGTRSEGPLLVATDGTARSDAALRAARAMAEVTGQKVLVLAVHAPLPVLGPEVPIATSPTMDLESRARLHDQVVEQMARVGLAEPWPVRVSTGSPPALIAKLAKTVDAALIVMGLGGHGVLDRIFGDEMALQVLRMTTVPVLAVADDFAGLPERVLVAMDFSSSAKRALELATPLVRAGGRITQVTVEHGDPSKELLRHAAEMRADLIVTGSHGHNFLSRLLVGSVSTRLLRKAGRTILVAPPLDVPDVEDELPHDEQRFRFYEWTERLEEFTRRNAGCRAKLEVFDDELGAQVVHEHVPFLGASFDPRDGRVRLMFGARDDGNGGTPHATHSIAEVTGIQTLHGRSHDAYLRIGHGRRQTLLTLER